MILTNSNKVKNEEIEQSLSKTQLVFARSVGFPISSNQNLVAQFGQLLSFVKLNSIWSKDISFCVCIFSEVTRLLSAKLRQYVIWGFESNP